MNPDTLSLALLIYSAVIIPHNVALLLLIYQRELKLHIPKRAAERSS